jgi:glycine oxidase
MPASLIADGHFHFKQGDKLNNSDAIIVGGGGIGCSIAWRLAQAGLSVKVIERNVPGSGASSSAGGMLLPQEESDGPGDMLNLMLKSRELYPAFSEELQSESGIEIEFKSKGSLKLLFDEEDEKLADECLEWHRREDLALERLTAGEVLDLEPNLGPDLLGALYYPTEGQVGNRKLVTALVAAARKIGVEFHNGEEMLGIRADERGVEIETSADTYTGQTAVLCGGAWSKEIGERLGFVLPVFPYKGQMVQLQVSAPMFERPILHRGSYLISKPIGRVLCGGTMEKVGFDKRVTGEAIHSILDNALRIAPCLSDAELVDTWSCFRPATPDGLPIIGRIPNMSNVIAATGHFRNGILLIPVTAELVAGLVIRGEEEGLAPFAPGRYWVDSD